MLKIIREILRRLFGQARPRTKQKQIQMTAGRSDEDFAREFNPVIHLCSSKQETPVEYIPLPGKFLDGGVNARSQENNWTAA